MAELLTMTDFISSDLFRRKSTLFFSLFIILTCIFCGFFFSRCLSSEDRSALTSPICDMSSSGSSSFLSGLLINILLLMLILLSGLSLYGFPVVPVILTVKGTALGFCAGLLFGSDAGSLMLPFIISCLFIIPAFTAASFSALNYAFINISRRSVPHSCRTEFIAVIILASLFAAAASAAEAIII